MPGPFLDWISTYGVVVLALLLMVGVFGLPVPDEALLTFAGVLVREGKLHFATTWTAAALGSMCGITLSYALGRESRAVGRRTTSAAGSGSAPTICAAWRGGSSARANGP